MSGYHTERPDPIIVRGLQRRAVAALVASSTRPVAIPATRPLVVDGHAVLAVERRSEVDLVAAELRAAGHTVDVTSLTTGDAELVSCLGARPVEGAWQLVVR